MAVKGKLKILAVFTVFFVIFLAVQSSVGGFFSSDDPYYHAKHSALIAESGDLDLVKPWIKFHFFSYAPADPWWGFHLAQALFIKFFGIIVGTKILSSLLAALVFAVFYYILIKQRVQAPLAWTALYFSSSALFLNRLLLERPFLLALSVLPLAFYLCTRRKYSHLFCLAFIYTLAYNQAPLIILLAVFYSAAEYFSKRPLDFKNIICAAGGVTAGFLLHPHGLNYIYVASLHFFQVVFLKFVGVNLSVGSEIQTPDFIDFISSNILAIVFYLLAVTIFFGTKEMRSGARGQINYFLFFYSFFWFFVSIILPRGVEYWLPFSWIFIACILSGFYESHEYAQTRSFLAGLLNLKVLSFFIAGFVAVMIFYNYSTVYLEIYLENRSSWSADLRRANDWLKNNTPAESVVFYNNWGMWPIMFYYNDHNRYVAGIDPTFLYEYDHELFWLWKNISYYGLYCGRQEICLDINPRDNAKLIKMAIKEKFQADYLLILNNPAKPLAKFLATRQQDFSQVFSNKKVLIYKLK